MCEFLGPRLNDDQIVFISGGNNEKCMKVSVNNSTEVPALCSNMEEADGRIIFHACFAADNGADTVVVSSPDTDVCVLLVHHRPAIDASNVYFLTGKDSKNVTHQRYIPIHKIFDHLSLEERSILLTVYCISGCDTVSAFFGHGKVKAFKIMQKHAG